MKTVFSHIVDKWLSQQYENVATEALAFIIETSEAARSGLMKLLRGIIDLPSLEFRTQQSEDGSRPDMWGYDGTTPLVFIESKFWAGLTDNQPVGYLRLLAKSTRPSVLLVIAPAARQETVWRELLRRLDVAQIGTSPQEHSAGTSHAVGTGNGPILALASWPRLLSAIEAELADEPQPRNDLLQLRALCEAASDAFVPLSPADLTDQRIPALLLQLGSIVQRAVDLGISQGFLSIDGVRPMSSSDRSGRYIAFATARDVQAWIGTDLRLWRRHGGTPLWLTFSPSKYGRAPEVHALLQPWADREGVVYTAGSEGLDVGLDLLTGEELDQVVRSLAACLKQIAEQLEPLPARDK
jgi:hypothetical protein